MKNMGGEDFPSGSAPPVVHLGMTNANIEIVTIHTPNRGAFPVAVYETKSLGWAGNYGSLETYHHASAADVVSSLRLSLSISSPAPSPSTALTFGRTLSFSERAAKY
jgi:hypothetical protein